MIVVFHQSSPHICLKRIVATSVIEQLTKKVTASVCSLKFIYGADSHCFSLSQSPSRCFTYHTDLNYVFATTRSSNCQFSMPIGGSILEFPPALATIQNRLPNNATMELPNGLSPSSFLLVKSKAWDKVQGFWFEVFLL